MSFLFEPYIALRYLRSKRKEVFISIITVISVLGVAVSVMVLDMTLSIMTGFEIVFRSKLVNANEQIVVRKTGGAIAVAESDELSKIIRGVSGVTEVFPFTYNQALLSSDQLARGLFVRGIADTPGSRAKFERTLEIDGGLARLFEPQFVEVARPDGELDSVQLPPLMLGRAVRDATGITEGTIVKLLSTELNSSPQGLIPKYKRFVVVGTYRSGLPEYENVIAYTSLKGAQDFFGLGEAVSGLEVELRDMGEAPAIAKTIESQIESVSRGYYVRDWTQTNQDFFEALSLEKRVYFWVLLLVVLIASFSIVATLVMVVMEKARDIAVLKTLGASNRSVLLLFFIQGTIIGILGTVIGTVLGFLGCELLRAYGFPLNERVFGMSEVPVYVDWTNFLIVAGSALAISCLAGIYPAWRAARLRPAEALRFE